MSPTLPTNFIITLHSLFESQRKIYAKLSTYDLWEKEYEIEFIQRIYFDTLQSDTLIASKTTMWYNEIHNDMPRGTSSPHCRVALKH